MRTLIRVRNANCPDCLNAIQDELLARTRVRAVHIHTADGCLEVEHDHDRPDTIVELLGRSLHGWQLADNAEIVQIAVVPELAHVCRVRTAAPPTARHGSPDRSELGGEAPCLAHLLDESDDERSRHQPAERAARRITTHPTLPERPSP